MEEESPAQQLGKMAIGVLNALEEFKTTTIAEMDKLEKTDEKINFIKKEIINLKKQAITSKADYVRTWNIKNLEKLLEDLKAIKELENDFQEDIKKASDSFIIRGKLNALEIEKYFMQLTDIHSDYPYSKKHKICVLNPAQIKALLNPQIKRQKYVTPDFSQQQLRTFIYRFKELHKSKDNTVSDFVKFEIDNFEAFAGLKEEKEYTNFNKGKARLSPPYDKF
jgi:hypothetical protein